jgi:glycosyltransferase involved in cell wall biosynthesis
LGKNLNLHPLKKALILTYYWPPSGGSGVQRWLKFAKYLREFGWEPVIYTAENGEVPVEDKSLLKDIPEDITVLKTQIWEPYDAYKAFMGKKKGDKMSAGMLSETKKSGVLSGIAMWIRGNFFIPDARRFWIKPSIRFLNFYLQNNSIDVIISTGPPHSMHLIARGVKRKHPHIPWIADFRDPWTNIDFYEELKLTFIADGIHKRLEKSVLAESDAVVSVGNTMSEELKVILNNSKQNAKFKVIPNGFDESDKPTSVAKKDDHFTIAHIGTLNKSRNPELLWNVLAELIHENKGFAENMRIKLVGKLDYSVLEAIEKHKLTPYLIKIDYLPHSEVMQVIQQSHVNLLLVNNTKNAKGILTGKIFEYLLAGPPVLAIGPPDGDLALLLKQTQGGYISDFKDKEGLKKNILALFEENDLTRNEKAIEQYSRRNLTGQLASLMNQVSA